MKSRQNRRLRSFISPSRYSSSRSSQFRLALIPKHHRRNQACCYLEEPLDRAVLPSSTYGKPATLFLNLAPRSSTCQGSWLFHTVARTVSAKFGCCH